jgi:hypothetical protein
MNAVILGLCPSSRGDVRAKTVKTLAKPPLVIQIFEPLRTYPPSGAGSAHV